MKTKLALNSVCHPQTVDVPTPTAEQRKAMQHVRNGADISDPFIAKTLRSVERDFPSLIWIGSPMGQYDGAKHVPHFGAILTAKGKEAI
jgi:hypothetical protein